MDEISFEWDLKKAASNAAKHGVTFEEAKTVFFDDDALVIPDPDHSKEEERFIIMGRSSESKILVVVHCFRKTGSPSELSRPEEREPRSRNHTQRKNHEN